MSNLSEEDYAKICKEWYDTEPVIPLHRALGLYADTPPQVRAVIRYLEGGERTDDDKARRKQKRNEYMRAYMQEYNARPGIKEKRRAYFREYYHRPEAKKKCLDRLKEYHQRPEVKARRAERSRVYMRAYRQRKKLDKTNSLE